VDPLLIVIRAKKGTVHGVEIPTHVYPKTNLQLACQPSVVALSVLHNQIVPVVLQAWVVGGVNPPRSVCYPVELGPNLVKLFGMIAQVAVRKPIVNHALILMIAPGAQTL